MSVLLSTLYFIPNLSLPLLIPMATTCKQKAGVATGLVNFQCFGTYGNFGVIPISCSRLWARSTRSITHSMYVASTWIERVFASGR